MNTSFYLETTNDSELHGCNFYDLKQLFLQEFYNDNFKACDHIFKDFQERLKTFQLHRGDFDSNLLTEDCEEI